MQWESKGLNNCTIVFHLVSYQTFHGNWCGISTRVTRRSLWCVELLRRFICIPSVHITCPDCVRVYVPFNLPTNKGAAIQLHPHLTTQRVSLLQLQICIDIHVHLAIPTSYMYVCIPMEGVWSQQHLGVRSHHLSHLSHVHYATVSSFPRNVGCYAHYQGSCSSNLHCLVGSQALGGGTTEFGRRLCI